MTKKEIEDMFHSIVCRALGIPEDDPHTIKFPYGTRPEVGSAPGPGDRMRDYCYIYVGPGNDPYGDQHHVSAQDTDPDSENLTYVDEYTQVHSVIFTFYGPSSDRWATGVRDALLRYDVRELLKKNRFALRLPMPLIQYLPDLHNGEWWRRHDLSTTFFEAVRVEIPDSVPTIETLNLQAIPESKK